VTSIRRASLRRAHARAQLLQCLFLEAAVRQLAHRDTLPPN